MVDLAAAPVEGNLLDDAHAEILYDGGQETGPPEAEIIAPHSALRANGEHVPLAGEGRDGLRIAVVRGIVIAGKRLREFIAGHGGQAAVFQLPRALVLRKGRQAAEILYLFGHFNAISGRTGNGDFVQIEAAEAVILFGIGQHQADFVDGLALAVGDDVAKAPPLIGRHAYVRADDVLLAVGQPNVGGDQRRPHGGKVFPIQIVGYRLPGIYGGGENGAVALVGKVRPAVIGLVEHAHALVPSGQAIHENFQAAAALGRKARAVGRLDKERIRHADVVRAAGKLKIKVNFAVFSFRGRRRVGRLAIQAGGKRGNLPGIGGNVQNVQITADAGEHNAVVYGRAVMRGKAVRAAKHAQNRADIAGVAVRVPAAHGGDFNGAGKIAVAVAQRQRAYAGVGNNVAYAGVTIVRAEL